MFVSFHPPVVSLSFLFDCFSLCFFGSQKKRRSTHACKHAAAPADRQSNTDAGVSTQPAVQLVRTSAKGHKDRILTNGVRKTLYNRTAQTPPSSYTATHPLIHHHSLPPLSASTTGQQEENESERKETFTRRQADTCTGTHDHTASHIHICT